MKLLEVINTEETLFIVMEYLSGGNLFTYLEAKHGLKEGEARGAFHQLVLALQHCHQQGMVHRDLKLSSLLLDANNNVNILDFGLSKHWHPRKKLATFCGSSLLTAPELFLGCLTQAQRWMCGASASSIVHLGIHHSNWIPPLQGTRFLGAAAHP